MIVLLVVGQCTLLIMGIIEGHNKRGCLPFREREREVTAHFTHFQTPSKPLLTTLHGLCYCGTIERFLALCLLIIKR